MASHWLFVLMLIESMALLLAQFRLRRLNPRGVYPLMVNATLAVAFLWLFAAVANYWDMALVIVIMGICALIMLWLPFLATTRAYNYGTVWFGVGCLMLVHTVTYWQRLLGERAISDVLLTMLTIGAIALVVIGYVRSGPAVQKLPRD